MKKFVLILVFLFFSCAFAQEALNTNDEIIKQDEVIYSDSYFNSLIEKSNTKINLNNNENKIDDYIVIDEIDLDESIKPLKLHIQEDRKILNYSQKLNKTNSKISLPVGNKFSLFQNNSKSINQYNTYDYKVLTGAEVKAGKFITLSSGFETKYRGENQNPNSKKFYFNPSIKLGKRVTLGLYNKYNMYNENIDNDVSINISPFKSNIMDFGIYAGTTFNQRTGNESKSINFSTNFFF